MGRTSHPPQWPMEGGPPHPVGPPSMERPETNFPAGINQAQQPSLPPSFCTPAVFLGLINTCCNRNGITRTPILNFLTVFIRTFSFHCSGILFTPSHIYSQYSILASFHHLLPLLTVYCSLYQIYWKILKMSGRSKSSSFYVFSMGSLQSELRHGEVIAAGREGSTTICWLR